MSIEAKIDLLEAFYGAQGAPVPSDALGMILWENVVYLAEDEKRRQAFERLRDTVGLTAEAILGASRESLLAVTRFGILPEVRVDRLKRIAEIVQFEYGGDLDAALNVPTPQAKRILRKFPSIGEPGADKILLFTRSAPMPGWDSNGLRVLVRLGYGEETANYAADYRSACRAVQSELPPERGESCAWLIRANQLLRLHGQKTCRRTAPLCSACPLVEQCPYANRSL